MYSFLHESHPSSGPYVDIVIIIRHVTSRDSLVNMSTSHSFVCLSGGGAGEQRQEADEGGGGAPSGSAGAAGGDPQTESPEPGAPARGTRAVRHAVVV